MMAPDKLHRQGRASRLPGQHSSPSAMLSMKVKGITPASGAVRRQPIQQGRLDGADEHHSDPAPQGKMPLPHIVEQGSYQQVPLLTPPGDQGMEYIQAMTLVPWRHSGEKGSLPGRQISPQNPFLLRLYPNPERTTELSNTIQSGSKKASRGHVSPLSTTGAPR